MTYLPFGAGTYTLNSSISSTATTITLTSFTEPVSGTPYTMTLLGTEIVYATIQPRTSSSEFVSFTGITQNADGTATLTGVVRGLAKKTPFTSSSTFKLPHAGQSIFIISDAPQVFVKYDTIENDTTITGRKIFPTGGSASAALAGATYTAPTQDNELATKKYIDDIAISGSPNATTAVKGIVQLATQAQLEAGTTTGSTGATLVLGNNQYTARNYIGYARDSGTVNTFVVNLVTAPAGYATGQYVAFQAISTNNGNSTLNVNGLGAKSLRLGGTGMFAGAISTNSMVGAIYNGTQFDAQIFDGQATAATANKLALRNSTGDLTVSATPTATTDATSKSYVDGISTIYKNGVTTKNAADASTAQTIAHGIGRIPKYVYIKAMCTGDNGGSMPAIAETVYNGTTQSSVSFYATGATFASSGGTVGATFTLNIAGAAGTTTGVVTFDATNITITWTKTNSPTGSYNIVWVAQG